MREEFELRRKMGIKLEFYDAAAVRKRFPFSRPAALFSQDGGEVDPHRLTHGARIQVRDSSRRSLMGAW